jgi:GT2 family glycosyltransferase
LDLGVIVLNWNGVDDTMACVASIYSQADVPAYVVVVDNGSVDDSVARVLAWLDTREAVPVASTKGESTVGEAAREFVLRAPNSPASACGGESASRFVLIENGRNLGFAAGNNVGLRFLLSREISLLLLLNNDTVVGAGALRALVSGMQEHAAVQCMIPQIRYWDAPDRLWNCGGSWSPLGGPRYHYAESNVAVVADERPFSVGFVTGCALVIRTAWLRSEGLLTERFFHGEEDVELSWRMRASGDGTMMCWPRAIVYHKVGVSLTRMAQRSKLPMTYCHYLNRLIFLRSVWGRGIRWQLRRWITCAYTGWSFLTKFGFSPVAALEVAGDLARDSSERDSVSADFFLWVMREKFAGRPSPS